MAGFNSQLGIAFGSQSTEGTIDPTIAALAGSLDLSDGIIIGSPSTGITESGISASFARRLSERGAVSGGFTKLASDFLEEEISLSFAFRMAGNRTTTPGSPADADFQHDPGIDALLAACGLAGAASTSNPVVGWKYSPADVALASARLFVSGQAWGLRDIRGDWSLALAPGEIGIMTCTLSAIVDSFAEVAFPTFDYEEQASVSAPQVAAVSPSWGGITRGWTDLTISCANALESIPDSSKNPARTIEQTGREISVAMTIRDDDSDIDFTRSELVRTTASTNDLTATVGTPASGSDTAEAYQLECSNIEVRDFTPAEAGRRSASQITGVCTGTTEGSEFFLAML